MLCISLDVMCVYWPQSYMFRGVGAPFQLASRLLRSKVTKVHLCTRASGNNTLESRHTTPLVFFQSRSEAGSELREREEAEAALAGCRY